MLRLIPSHRADVSAFIYGVPVGEVRQLRIVFTLGGTDAGRSGLGSYVNAVLPELRQATQRAGVELVALGSRDEVAAYADALEGVTVLCAPRWTDSPGPSALWYLAAAGRTAKLGGDVMLYSAANRRFGAINPRPAVAVVHDLGPLYVPEKYDPLRLAYFRYGLLPVLRRATRLVAISEATRADLVRALGVEREQVDIVPNGVDIERFTPLSPDDPEVARVRRELGIGRPYVLYPSRLEHPAKNHVRLIAAFARSRALATHELVLAGADWGGRPTILDAVFDHNLQDRVRLTGYVKDELLPPLLAGADSVAMVGLREGFGLPALEALASGRPVFAADTGALPEVLGQLGAFCNPLDTESIAAALDRTTYDEALRAECAREGPLRAAEFSWHRTAEGLLASCRTALDAHSGEEAAQ